MHMSNECRSFWEKYIDRESVESICRQYPRILSDVFEDLVRLIGRENLDVFMISAHKVFAPTPAQYINQSVDTPSALRALHIFVSASKGHDFS